jgi:hypothetical protein
VTPHLPPTTASLSPTPAAEARCDTAQAVAALRARGADPVRLRYIEALARRALQHEGAPRRLLDGRVQQLLAASPCPAQPSPHLPALSSPAPARRPTMAALLAYIASRDTGPGAGPPAAGAPELKAVRDYRSTWSRLHMEQRLTLALAKVPDNAGPLNTPRLLHQALAVMRASSPAYLQRFMVQVEALLWLEQLNQGAPPAAGKPGSRKARR